MAALVTHLHSDHADPAAIARALADDGVVLRPGRSAGEGLDVAGMAVAEAGFAELAIEQRNMAWWDRATVGPFAVTAVPAVDGFGDPQNSWVVEVDGVRIFHGGDTLFHGWWWPIRERCGPIDLALLPINGPSVDLPHKQPPHDLPAALDPRQAANAAAILRAKLAVGIHYDTFNKEPTYVQVIEPSDRFAEEAGKLGVAVAKVDPGRLLDLGAIAPRSAPAT
ncbi:MBL fold metallo-hydrolase [soil metagenome]